jgi:hypothetical protein
MSDIDPVLEGKLHQVKRRSEDKDLNPLVSNKPESTSDFTAPSQATRCAPRNNRRVDHLNVTDIAV